MTRLILVFLTGLMCACGATSRRPAPVTPSSYDAPSTVHVDRGLLTAAEAVEVDRLILGLFNEDKTTRILSARHLGRFGPKARPALPYLIDCVVTDANGAGAACAEAAGNVGDDGRDKLRALACGSREAIADVALAALDEPAALECRARS